MAASTAPAWAGGHWQFEIENNSSLVADGFRTQENDQWSDNWLNTQIGPGDVSSMDFNHDDGSCVVRTQIRFTDDTYFDYDVDYCKVNRLHIFKNSVKWE